MKFRNSDWRTKDRKLLLVVLVAVISLFAVPFLFGVLEAKAGRTFIVSGPCAIDNPRRVLEMGDRSIRLVSGTARFEGKEYSHMWGVRPNGQIIDVTAYQCDAQCSFHS